MNRKRLVVGIGLLAAGVTLPKGIRHCRRMMSEHCGIGRQPEASRSGGGTVCCGDQIQGSPALAA